MRDNGKAMEGQRFGSPMCVQISGPDKLERKLAVIATRECCMLLPVLIVYIVFHPCVLAHI